MNKMCYNVYNITYLLVFWNASIWIIYHHTCKQQNLGKVLVAIIYIFRLEYNTFSPFHIWQRPRIISKATTSFVHMDWISLSVHFIMHNFDISSPLRYSLVLSLSYKQLKTNKHYKSHLWIIIIINLHWRLNCHGLIVTWRLQII